MAESTDGEDFPASEQILLDVAQLAHGSPYLDVGVCEVSPDERFLAYSVDRTGDEVYVLAFRDLDTGEDLPEVLPRTYYSGGWSADSTTFLYTVHDRLSRPHQVWRHTLGTPVASDVMVLEEPDQRFEVSVRLCRSGDLMILDSRSRDTSEVWLVDAHHPTRPARVVEPRRPGVEYSCEHARTPHGGLLIVTNDGSPEFRLVGAAVEDPGRRRWEELLAGRTSCRLLSVDAFAGHLVLTLRDVSSRFLRVLPHGDGASYDLRPGPVAGTIRLDANTRYETAEVTVAEGSYTEPTSWYAVDLATGARRLRKRAVVPSYDPAGYLSERRSFPCGDGVEVPVTVVRRHDVPLDGTPPCVLHGYGAYEAVDEPEFDPAIVALVDRGVVFAYAHVRGGGEGGRAWWLGGRLSAKQNTFGDYLAAADGLAGLVDGRRVVSRGLSAGGLLQGAVFSQAPGRWAGVVAESPFVDVVTTMSDATIALTVTEWDEWGDPSRPEDFAWMLAYSPYDNPPGAGHRPPLLVTGALHDPRVMVWEPAKWVAALRAGDPDWAARCLFRCETGEGAHVGPSGRYRRIGYEAEICAWMLEQLGL